MSARQKIGSQWRSAVRPALIIVIILAVGVRFERILIALALSAALVVAYVVLGYRANDSIEAD